MLVLNPTEPAIVRGIKTAGIGKKGSKPLTPELCREILEDLRAGKAAPIAQGAFFGALIMKGVALEEQILGQAFDPGTLGNPARLLEALSPEAPTSIKQICIELLEKKELDKQTAYQLGKFLLSAEPGDGARGMAVSILRVRYETHDEYEGLLKSFQESLEPAFRTKVPAGEPIIQLAEPFDGVDQSYMITPVVAKFLQTQGYRVISMVGRNSGPKLVNNLLDLVSALKIECAKGNEDLKNEKPSLGWYFNQKNLSKDMDRWVELRRQTIKRPCFATLEKFLNPVNAAVIITSAFHPPYGEKMTTVAERAGFAASIVIRNGIEGTIAFPLKRSAKILCSVKQSNGQYLRNEFDFNPVSFLGQEVDVEEKLEKPDIQENARLVEQFVSQGKTNNQHFDLRIKTTCAGIKQAIEWIERNKS